MFESWNEVFYTISLFGKKHFDITIWVIIGFIGQQLFTARTLIQWVASEKAKKSVVPVSFWWLSLIANFIVLFYSLNQSKYVDSKTMTFVFIFTINIVPYIRNLIIAYKIKSKRVNYLTFLISFFVFGISIFELVRIESKPEINFWFVIGTIGSFGFGIRFILQWIYAEYHKESVLPLWFWLFSIVTSIMNLVYAFYLNDITFTIGFIFNTIPMVRNIMLGKKSKKSIDSAPAESEMTV